jgi:hypothetical protein
LNSNVIGAAAKILSKIDLPNERSGRERPTTPSGAIASFQSLCPARRFYRHFRDLKVLPLLIRFLPLHFHGLDHVPTQGHPIDIARRSKWHDFPALDSFIVRRPQ